ncbi:hypothetical protein Leryth_012735, partial [Lithospermum erythrorhizon]
MTGTEDGQPDLPGSSPIILTGADPFVYFILRRNSQRATTPRETSNNLCSHSPLYTNGTNLRTLIIMDKCGEEILIFRGLKEEKIENITFNHLYNKKEKASDIP